MKATALIPTTVAIMLALTFVACKSEHLSRANAKAQLEKAARQAQQETPDGPHSLTTNIGIVSGGCYDQQIMHDYNPVESSKEDAVLAATGYIKTRPIKKNVWSVELTPLGQQALGSKYGHTQKADCDEWQVQFPLSKYDHLDVTGIVEDGVHAKVDASLTFIILPVGMAARLVASSLIFEIDKKQYGEKLANSFRDQGLDSANALLGDDLVYAQTNANTYAKQGTFAFDKYDDGWKLSTKEK